MKNFEGLGSNTYPINTVRPYENIRDSRIVLPNSSDRTSLNGTLDKYLDRTTLTSAIYSNPEISKMLSEKGIPIKLNIDAFKKHVYNHSIDTKNTAIGIYNRLPKHIQSQANLTAIADGAVLHDIGKILIPENILTKHYKLNPKEEDIMHLHSSLSYEILKNQKLPQGVLDIVKYHHQNPAHTGYPNMPESKTMDINTQIVAMADKYSALREKRTYKQAVSPQETLNILQEEMNKGVSPDVYRALSNYALSNKTNNTTTLSNYLDRKNTPPQINRNATFYA